MKYALFLGCNIPARVSQYEASARAVLKTTSIELVDIQKFNCCGYPMRNISQEAFILSAARNLALAEEKNLDILTLCKCCYGALKNAEYLIQEDTKLKKQVNATLARDNVEYTGKFKVKHFLSALYYDVGMDILRKKILKSYKNLAITVHYGCHALRPSKITQFDNSATPSLFDELVEITGAKSIDWNGKLDCCGAPLTGINDNLSMDLTQKKLQNSKKAGADYLCTACPFCHLQFNEAQKRFGNEKYPNEILYPQLLGLCMGIDAQTLGIDINDFKSFLE